MEVVWGRIGEGRGVGDILVRVLEPIWRRRSVKAAEGARAVSEARVGGRAGVSLHAPVPAPSERQMGECRQERAARGLALSLVADIHD